MLVLLPSRAWSSYGAILGLGVSAYKTGVPQNILCRVLAYSKWSIKATSPLSFFLKVALRASICALQGPAQGLGRKHMGSSNSKQGPENQNREGERKVAGLFKRPQLDLVLTGYSLKSRTHGSCVPGCSGVLSSSCSPASLGSAPILPVSGGAHLLELQPEC